MGTGLSRYAPVGDERAAFKSQSSREFRSLNTLYTSAHDKQGLGQL